MGTPSNIDIEALLAPISAEAPSGKELDKADADSPYYHVKGLRDTAKQNEEDEQQALMLGDDADSYDRADWGAVVTAATEALQETSKDFRIACWLAEALIREHGFSGLRDGLALCLQICETYWDTIHPQPNEEEGHGETVAMFNTLSSDTAIRFMMQLPITGANDGIRYSLIDYSTTIEPEERSEGDDAGPRSSGGISYSEFQQAVMAADASHYQEMIEDQNESIELLRTLTSFLDDKCQPDEYDQPTSPSATKLRQELEEATRIIGIVARPLLENGEEVSPEEAEEGQQANSPPPGPRGTINSREDAFRALQKVSDYFERTEPHSPVPYALRQVMKWGQMSLPDLLRDLINDEQVRDDLTRRVGVPLVDNEE